MRTISGGGKYTLNEENDLQVKFALLSKKLETIELKKVHKVRSISKQDKYRICEDISRVAFECPTISAFKEVFFYASHPVNMIFKTISTSYSNPYNVGCRNHHNFS